MGRCHAVLKIAAAVLALGGCVMAQDTPNELLKRVQHQVAASLSHAPNYTCTETVNRFSYLPAGHTHASCDGREFPDSDYEMRAKDRLRLDVGVSGASEIYSWHGEKRFQEGGIDELVGYGAIGSGMFSSFLAAIFDDAHGTFRFEREYTQNGRSVSVFSYTVPRNVSTWQVQAGETKAIVGYQGRFVVDSGTADLLALSVETIDVTHSVATSCGIRISTQYHRVPLGSGTFLLPQQVKTVMLNRDGGKNKSETEYSDCHQFTTESSIHFEDPGSTAAAVAAAPPVDADLPADLSFRARVTTPVDPESSWVGDSVEGVLEEPLRGLDHETLAPKGAKITGRLTRLESVEQPSKELKLAIDWQRIDAGKTIYHLAARKAGSTDRSANKLGETSLSLQETVPDQTFTLKGAHTKLGGTFVSRWVTEKLPAGTRH